MTGTSIDGIDAALVEIEGEGLGLQAHFVKGVSASLGALGSSLRKLADGLPFSAGEITRMASDLGRIHLEALRVLLDDARPDLIVLHGQTVFHKPPLSWQLINPWPVVNAFKTEVIWDLRGADLATGGEGAPITPLADFILFRNAVKARMIVNFGGFINYTYIPAGDGYMTDSANDLDAWLKGVRGGDVSPCNQLLDKISRQLLGKPFDDGGEAAMQGRVDDGALSSLVKRLTPLSTNIHSLGTGDEAFDWCEEYKERLNPNDLLRTACAAITERLASVVMKHGECEIVVAGGGVNNRTLIMEIENRLQQKFRSTESDGIPSEYREAVAMGILGELASKGIAITLPQITGRVGEMMFGCRTGGYN